jgi:hypothetical protein
MMLPFATVIKELIFQLGDKQESVNGWGLVSACVGLHP